MVTRLHTHTNINTHSHMHSHTFYKLYLSVLRAYITVRYATINIIKMYKILLCIFPKALECVENLEIAKAGEFCKIRIVSKSKPLTKMNENEHEF